MSPLRSKVYKGRSRGETSEGNVGESVMVEEEEEKEVRETLAEEVMGETLQKQM